MGKQLTLPDYIAHTEHQLARYKLVYSKYPDAKVISGNSTVFSSKTVNNDYSKLEFFPNSWQLIVCPYTELTLEHNGITETLKIHSSPRRNRLARVSWRVDKDGKRVMKFSRFLFNMKRNKFREDLFNSCRTAIMDFIQKNPKCTLDTKHLEPRLQKLLLFT